MRPSLRAASRLFRNIDDREPLPQVYVPELNDVIDIRRESVRKIMRLKGKNSGAVISVIPVGYGWFIISEIYWKPKNRSCYPVPVIIIPI